QTTGTADLTRAVAGQWTRRRLLQRTALAALAAGAAGNLWAACAPGSSGGPSPTASAASAKVKGGHLAEGFVGAIRTLDAIVTGSGTDFILKDLMFDTLLGFNAAGDVVATRLAASLPTVSPDERTVTFKLRPNLKWTDGHDLTADDVVFTFGL